MDTTKWKKVIDRVPHILWRGVDGCTFLGKTVAVHEGWDAFDRSIYLRKHESILLIKVLSDDTAKPLWPGILRDTFARSEGYYLRVMFMVEMKGFDSLYLLVYGDLMCGNISDPFVLNEVRKYYYPGICIRDLSDNRYRMETSWGGNGITTLRNLWVHLDSIFPDRKYLGSEGYISEVLKLDSLCLAFIKKFGRRMSKRVKYMLLGLGKDG